MSTEDLFGAVGAAVAAVAREKGRPLDALSRDFIAYAAAAATQRDEQAVWLILAHFIEHALGGLPGVQPIVMPISGVLVKTLAQRLCVYAAVLKELTVSGQDVDENGARYSAAEESSTVARINAVTEAYDARISAIRGNRPAHALVGPEDSRLILLACAELLVETLRKDGEP